MPPFSPGVGARAGTDVGELYFGEGVSAFDGVFEFKGFKGPGRGKREERKRKKKK